MPSNNQVSLLMRRKYWCALMDHLRPAWSGYDFYFWPPALYVNFEGSGRGRGKA